MCILAGNSTVPLSFFACGAIANKTPTACIAFSLSLLGKIVCANSFSDIAAPLQVLINIENGAYSIKCSYIQKYTSSKFENFSGAPSIPFQNSFNSCKRSSSFPSIFCTFELSNFSKDISYF